MNADGHTAESDAGGGNDAGLDNGVLLPGKGLLQHPRLLEELGPRLHEEEAQQSRGHVEGWYNTGCQVQLHHNEGEENRQHEADHKGPQGQLLLP